MRTLGRVFLGKKGIFKSNLVLSMHPCAAALLLLQRLLDAREVPGCSPQDVLVLPELRWIQNIPWIVLAGGKARPPD